MFPSLSTLIGGGTDLGDVSSPVGNGPIYIGVETPFKLSDRLPIATTGRVTDIHREKSRTKMEGPSDQGMDSMPLFVVPFCANDPGDLTMASRAKLATFGTLLVPCALKSHMLCLCQAQIAPKSCNPKP